MHAIAMGGYNGKTKDADALPREAPMNTVVDYELLAQQIEALAQADNHWLPVLPNASALLFEAMENINWAGFYVVDESTRGQETPELRLGPFQGKVACVRIPFGRGVCGTAAAENKTQLVPDVHAFLGHIACDAASRSEVVVPLHCGGASCRSLGYRQPITRAFLCM